MKKKRTRKDSVAELIETPLPMASPRNGSPIFANNSKKASAVLSKSPPYKTNLSSISELKDMASSRLDDLKRLLDRSHSEILKDVDASHSRLQKRFKIQNQACQQLWDEAEKEYKKINERITEGREAMQASYDEFIAEAQASANRACKTSIAELSESFEKAINALRNRFGIPST